MAQVRESLLACAQAGIAVVASVIIPAPFETELTEEGTFDLLMATRPDSVVVTPGADVVAGFDQPILFWMKNAMTRPNRTSDSIMARAMIIGV